jgi:hypothetical protein
MGGEAMTVAGVLQSVADMGDVITSIPSVRRFFHVPGIATVPLTDVEPGTMALLTRADDDRRLVADFARPVRAVAARGVGLVPGATVLEPAGARPGWAYIRSGASTPSSPRPVRTVCATATQQSRRKAATGAGWPITGQRS